MNRRNIPLVAGLVVFLAAGAWYLTQASDEAKIAKLIDEVTKAGDVSQDGNPILRAARVRSAMEKAFSPEARVDVPELGGGGLSDVETAAIAAPHFLQDGTVRITHLQITLDEAHTVAKATGTAEFDGHRGTDHKQGERPVDLQLRKIDGNWKIETVHSGAL